MKKALFALGLLAVPGVAAAQSLGNFEVLLQSIGRLVDIATPIVVGIALLAFFWGLATFIFSAGNDDAQKRGKTLMLWGVIALFIMVSIWGIVRFIGSALGISEGGAVTPPTVNF